MQKARKLFLFILVISFTFGYPQLSNKDTDFFGKYEDSLQTIAKKLFATKVDSLKISYNEQFSDLWEAILLNGLSYYWDFDSLKKDVYLLKSTDKKLRIVNWNLAMADGTYKYYGFIQSLYPRSKKYEVYQLKDVSESVKNAETYNGDNTKWYGMLYYNIIQCNGYYTLLGWDGNDKLTTKKIVDVLSFKADGSPQFGKNIFNNVPKKYPKRLILEFASECSISLKYKEKEKSIIFNHLAPPDPFLDGQYEFYIPDGTFDCLEYKNNSWVYIEDFDARNGKNKNENTKRGKTKEKPIYIPH